MSTETDNSPSESPSRIIFQTPISPRNGIRLIQQLQSEFLPKMHKQYPTMKVTPLYDLKNKLNGIDFEIQLENKLRKLIAKKITQILTAIQQADLRALRTQGMKDPISFTDILGTYRVSLNQYLIPIVITIVLATFFAWLSWDVAQIQYDSSFFDVEETGTWGAILNGLIPVLISATSITLIWLLVRKKGMNVFRVIMGFFVLFYNWIGITYYLQVITFIIYPDGIVPLFVAIIYYGIFYGSIIALIIIGIFFFRDRLKTWQKNLLVLVFGVFLGSIFATYMDTLSTFIFIIFLSIWDIIAVFKGPLGKIGEMILENRRKLQEALDPTEIETSETSDYTSNLPETQQSKQQEAQIDGKYIREHMAEIEIELGSGDLIFYSALVAHTVVRTGDWLLSLLVIIGVLLGAVLTIRRLFENKKMLPALPFSMFFGIGLFLFGLLIRYLQNLIF